jgi:cell division protein FtsB
MANDSLIPFVLSTIKTMSMTKIKILIVSAIVGAALAVPVVMQQQTIKALRQENEGLKQQVAQIAPLQEKLAQDAANADGGAALQETQVHELARLRGEVARLRPQTSELAKARQEIQTLNQRMASEREARRSATGAVQSETSRAQSMMNACINNLRLIDGSKQQWALEQRKQIADTPTWDDLRPYLGHGPNGDLPTCPAQGAYTIGTVGEKPTCSIAGHVLP